MKLIAIWPTYLVIPSQHLLIQRLRSFLSLVHGQECLSTARTLMTERTRRDHPRRAALFMKHMQTARVGRVCNLVTNFIVFQADGACAGYFATSMTSLRIVWNSWFGYQPRRRCFPSLGFAVACIFWFESLYQQK